MNELDLTFLLKGYKGIKFFSTLFGDTEIIEVYPNDCIDVCPYGCHDEVATIFINGNFGKDGQCVLYPSRALYEKYPLDGFKAWAEWAQERKPKYEFSGCMYIYKDGETVLEEDLSELTFDSSEEAQQAAEEVRKCLENLHKRKEGEK